MIDAASPVREKIYGAIRAFTSSTVSESEDATKKIIRVVNDALPNDMARIPTADRVNIDTLVEALEAMRAEFRAADLPYGSLAYQMAGEALERAQRRKIMSNDHRDWTNGRFMHAPPVKMAPPTDKEIIDALVAALKVVKSMRTVDGLAPAVHEFEHKKRHEAWTKIDSEIDAALELASKGETL